MKKIPGTILLLAINVLVFAGMAISLNSIFFDRPQDYLAMVWGGANLNPLTIGGDYWRLFSSMFMHWGIIHLAANMYGLYVVGRMLEPFMGTVRLVLLYLITGVCAGIASLVFNVYVASAGASGAIFGMYGYYILWVVLSNDQDRQALGNILFNFIIFVAVNYMIARSMNVDTPAHIGGFVTGALLSVANFFRLLLPRRAYGVLLVTTPFMVLAVPKGQLYYYNVFQTVIRAERHVDELAQSKITEKQFTDSLVVVEAQWDSARQQLDAIQSIQAELQSDTATMSRYITLQQRSTRFRRLMMEKESYTYLDSIELINAELGSLPQFKYHPNYKIEPGEEPPAEDEEKESSESSEPIKVFYDSSWKETDNRYIAHYYRLGTRDSLNRWQGEVYDYFINDQIQMKGRYKDGMRNGVFRYYTRQNKYEALGRYEMEYAVGRWENYFSNGQMQSEVFYQDKTYTRSVWDSLGNPQVIDGNGKETTWHANGKVAEEGSYENGLKEGYWYGYYASGKPHYQELYRDNLLVRGVAMNEKGDRFVYDQLSVFPFPEIGMPAYRKYLQENLRRPPGSEDRHGEVKLTFTVDVTGDIRDFVVTQSLDLLCDKEAVRLVQEGPRWRPGVLRGHIKQQGNGYVNVLF